MNFILRQWRTSDCVTATFLIEVVANYVIAGSVVNWRLIFENQLIVVRLKVARCKLQVNQRLRRPLHQALPAYANLRQPMPSIASLPPPPF